MTLKFTDISNLANGVISLTTAKTPEDRTAATKTTIKSVFSIIDKVQDAKAETQENADGARELDQEAQDIRTRTYQRAEANIKAIEENAARVQSLLENLQARNEEIAAHQEELNVQKEIIENNKTVLNNPESTRAERREALENIKAAGNAITELEVAIQTATQETEVFTTEIEETTAVNEELNSASQEIVQEGSSKIQEVQAQAAGELTQTVTSTVAQGTQDIATGTTQVAEGTIMLTNGFTAVPGQRLVNKGTKSIEAGSIRTGESAITIGNITSTCKFISSALGQFSNLNNTMLDSYNNTSNVLGLIDNNFKPFITTLGSWTSIEGAGAEYVARADEEIARLENQGENEDENPEGTDVSESTSKDPFDTRRLELDAAV